MKQPIRESPLSDRDLQFLQMGRAATIPGIQFAIDVLLEHMTLTKTEMYSIQDLLTQRNQTQATAREARLLQASAVTTTGKRRGRPPKNKIGTGIKAYWASMTEEERSAEMLRRRTKGLGIGSGPKKGPTKKLHPRDKAHPDHAKWLANMTKAVRKRWKGYSPEERTRRAQIAVAGRKAKTPTVILERTA